MERDRLMRNTSKTSTKSESKVITETKKTKRETKFKVASDPCDETAVGEDSLASCSFVLFGATGDLTHRKIVPALFSLFTQNLLPKGFTIVAFARRDKTSEIFRDDLKGAIDEFAPQLKTDGPEWSTFAASVYYVKSNFDEPEGYK